MTTSTTRLRCRHVLREGEYAVRVRTHCEEPARWRCANTGLVYCDEHAHVHACCQMDGPHEGEEA